MTDTLPTQTLSTHTSAVLVDTRTECPVAAYEVVAHYHTQPDGTLVWVDWRRPEDYEEVENGPGTV